ncbi:MAG: GNAT family N-acetyltransferase [Stappiaceae bacterium]
MQSILPKFDQTESDRITSASAENIPALISSFTLARTEPENFLKQVTWHVSDAIDDMFIEQAAESPASCFHARIWIESWAKSIAADRHVSVKVVVGSISDVPVIAIPMCSISTGLLTSVQFTGQDVCDYNTPIVHRELSFFSSRQLMEYICLEAPHLFSDADCFDLRKCLFEDDMLPEKGALWQEEPDNAHLCHLSGNWEEDLPHFVGKSSRKSLKRKLKKLQSMGDVTFREASTEAHRKLAIEKLIDWKTEQLKDLGAASIFQSRPFCDLLRTAVMEDRSDQVRVFGMYIDEKPVALTLMLCRESRWFLYQTAYTSEEAGKYSPGYLLLLHIMEEASNQNIPIFDFGWGNEAYKARFATFSLCLYRAFVPLSLKGRIARYVLNTVLVAKELAKSNRYTRFAATFMLRTTALLKRR